MDNIEKALRENGITGEIKVKDNRYDFDYGKFHFEVKAECNDNGAGNLVGGIYNGFPSSDKRTINYRSINLKGSVDAMIPQMIDLISQPGKKTRLRFEQFL